MKRAQRQLWCLHYCCDLPCTARLSPRHMSLKFALIGCPLRILYTRGTSQDFCISCMALDSCISRPSRMYSRLSSFIITRAASIFSRMLTSDWAMYPSFCDPGTVDTTSQHLAARTSLFLMTSLIFVGLKLAHGLITTHRLSYLIWKKSKLVGYG